jgi:hypothetical protein
MAVSPKAAPVAARHVSDASARTEPATTATALTPPPPVEERNPPKLDFPPKANRNRGIPYRANGKTGNSNPAKKRPQNLRTDFSPRLRLELCVDCEPVEKQEESQ